MSAAPDMCQAPRLGHEKTAYVAAWDLVQSC